MDKKLLIIFNKSEDDQFVKDTIAVEPLAQYPDSVLIRCTEMQQQTLEKAGLEVIDLTQTNDKIKELQQSKDKDDTADLRYALESDPASDPNRIAYYLVSFIGPAKTEWFEAIRGQGGDVHGNLFDFTWLVGIPPTQAQTLEDQDWVEDPLIKYGATLKISPTFYQDIDANDALLSLEGMDNDASDIKLEVEIAVFPNEDLTPIVTRIGTMGGQILSANSRTIIAVIPKKQLHIIAEEAGVQAILPHGPAVWHNDRAAEVMRIPENRAFGALFLTGEGQIVAIADSGLDMGNPNNIHPDFAGRIVGIESWPVDPIHNERARFINGPMPYDDGSADLTSHGTHVAGSVLGNGAKAEMCGSSVVPKGIAPKARLYFQAIGQRVNWKSKKQLEREGIEIPPQLSREPDTLWGLPENNLTQLFKCAYAAGARIHTNSWGKLWEAGAYPETSLAVDEFMWSHRDMLILVAAGNTGWNKKTGEIYAGRRDRINPPGTAKNCLTVGASENNRPPNKSEPKPGYDIYWRDLVAPEYRPYASPRVEAAGHISDNPNGMAVLSAPGSHDRQTPIKPDVVAPGTNILSTRSRAYTPPPDPDEEVQTTKPPGWGDLACHDPLYGWYHWYGGTSMSTPLVAGAAALVREYLVKQRQHYEDGVKPSGALIKAILINGATAMSGQFDGEFPPELPNHVCGFGRINLIESFSSNNLDQMCFIDDPDYALEAYQTRIFEFKVADPCRSLRVTLAWTDLPGPRGQGSTPAIQIKLSLILYPPEGPRLYGHNTPMPTNNAQRIVVEHPTTTGIYTVRIRYAQPAAQSLGSGLRQDFALVVSNALDLRLVETKSSGYT